MLREEDPLNPLQNELDVEIEASDDLFVNDEGISPPRTRRKRDIMDYEQKLREANFKTRERAFKIKTSQYKVQKLLAENDNASILISLRHSIENLIGSLSHIDRNISGIKSDMNNMKSDMNNMKLDLNNISNKINEITPLMHHVRVSENLRRRTFGLPQLPLPFLVGEGPSGTNLPNIESVQDIQDLTRAQLLSYLAGYGVEYNRRASNGSLKSLLRLTLGFTLPTELNFFFS